MAHRKNTLRFCLAGRHVSLSLSFVSPLSLPLNLSFLYRYILNNSLHKAKIAKYQNILYPKSTSASHPHATWQKAAAQQLCQTVLSEGDELAVRGTSLWL